VLSADTPYKAEYKPLPPRRTTLSAGLQRTVTGVDDRLPPMEQILALDAGGRHRAYPLAAVAAADGVVNEVVGDIPVVVLMDRRTRAMTAFRRTADGRTLTFEPAEGGVARDRETGSLWRIDGIAASGPLKSLKLAPVNFHVGAWYSWVAYFPETTLYGR
jgi:Protein of unknown function (DUF3179)